MAKIQSNFISVLKIWNDYLSDEQAREIFNQLNIIEIMTNYCLSGAPKPVFGHTLERIEYTTFILLIRDLIKTGEIKLLRAIGFIKSEFDEYINSLRISIEQDKIDNTIGKLRTDYIQNQNNEIDLQRYNELLAKELEEQKKINSESVYIPPLNIADTDNLVSENNQLKIDNKNLTEQLNQAKKEIEELKNNHSQNLNDQLKKESPKTINAQAKFIKALIHHYYGEEIANNPRPHIENKDGEIKRDFETQGLSKNLPTGVVVKKWVDSIELEIDS